jgi:hypothetical protein
MKQPTRRQRIGLTVSAVWILVVFVLVYEESRKEFEVGLYIMLAILPVLIPWATWWIWRARPKADRRNNCKNMA